MLHLAVWLLTFTQLVLWSPRLLFGLIVVLACCFSFEVDNGRLLFGELFTVLAALFGDAERRRLLLADSRFLLLIVAALLLSPVPLRLRFTLSLALAEDCSLLGVCSELVVCSKIFVLLKRFKIMLKFFFLIFNYNIFLLCISCDGTLAIYRVWYIAFVAWHECVIRFCCIAITKSCGRGWGKWCRVKDGRVAGWCHRNARFV